MPWQNQGGGGPWGGGSGGGGNNGGGGGGPWGRGPGGGGGPQPPDMEELLRKSQERVKSLLPGSGGGVRGAALVVVVGAALWLASGFYRVQPDQQGVVMTFGEWTATTTPGLNWRWPAPIQTVLTPSVTTENRIEVGVGGRSSDGRTARGESLMLTGDENIVDIDFMVLWRIKDAGHYLFNVREPDALIKVAAESAMREVVAQTPIQQAFTEGRGKIETETQVNLQKMLDTYKLGVEITRVQLLTVDPPAPVIDAFNEVQSARADRERLRNEAEAYRNDVIPRARGESEQVLQEAQAYREEVVNRAQGDAKRFMSVYESYKIDPNVTSQRMYLETMEEVLRGAPKVILDNKNGGVAPYLPLPALRAPTAAPAPASTQGAK